MDIAAWLNRLGLDQYEQAFRENDVDAEVLPELMAEDLIGLGVTSIGHRRKLLAAIAALREKPPPPNELTAPIAPPTAKEDLSGLASSSAERRQLTVMFCDLVGSTPLSARLDPEDLRGIIGAYHRCVTEIVEGFGGFVARYMGDGVLVYFGYPQAHEDDAERATRCGLALVDRVPQLKQAEELHARVGIATGLVVVGGEVVEHDVAGDTPNLAARLQALAEPDTVVIAASTRRLIGDLFEYRDLGAVEVKGIAAPVPAWQVLRPSAVASRFEALRGAALSPLVGRDEEIELLLRRWARAKAGDGQVVLISGEPGIGKSRLDRGIGGAPPAPSRISGCAISARPITRTARFTRLSTSSAGQRGLRATIRLRPGWRSSKSCWPAPRRQTRMWRSSPICCHCRLRSAIRCRTSVLSGKRKRHWKR